MRPPLSIAPFAILLCSLLSGGIGFAGTGFAGSGLEKETYPEVDTETAKLTVSGRYRVAFASTLEPLTINRMHAWVVKVTGADGVPVEDAELTVSGGMPAHDHGLPTAPRATANLGGGHYLVEGMKFHMNGAWDVVMTVEASAGRDSVTWRLDL